MKQSSCNFYSSLMVRDAADWLLGGVPPGRICKAASGVATEKIIRAGRAKLCRCDITLTSFHNHTRVSCKMSVVPHLQSLQAFVSPLPVYLLEYRIVM
jgi:hypothetical protein